MWSEKKKAYWQEYHPKNKERIDRKAHEYYIR